MNRALPYINLIGVLALGLLCAIQWQANRKLNLETIRLEQVSRQQAEELSKRETNLRGSAADLDSFRRQLADVSKLLQTAEARAAATERQVQQLTLERDELKKNVEKWAQAVTQRDDRLKEIEAQLKKLAIERNEVVTKYNDLAVKHNTVVKDLNEARTNLNEARTRLAALLKEKETAPQPK